MATISVKFRQSTVEGKAGTVFYQVIHKRRMARINTDIHLLPCEWQKVSNRTNGSEDYLMLVRNKIDSDLSVTALIINSCEESGKEYSAKTIVQLFKAKGICAAKAFLGSPPTWGSQWGSRSLHFYA